MINRTLIRIIVFCNDLSCNNLYWVANAVLQFYFTTIIIAIGTHIKCIYLLFKYLYKNVHIHLYIYLYDP